MIRLQSELIFDKSEAMSIHMKEDNDILKESRKRKDAQAKYKYQTCLKMPFGLIRIKYINLTYRFQDFGLVRKYQQKNSIVDRKQVQSTELHKNIFVNVTKKILEEQIQLKNHFQIYITFLSDALSHVYYTKPIFIQVQQITIVLPN